MKICPACSREYGNEHTHCRDDGVGLVHLDTGTSERAQDLIGQVVDGRFRIERIVGRGGMGTVYACRHVVVGKAFAMKVLRQGIERSEEILQRFIREAQAANSVQSRHICEMTDFGQLPGGAFYVVMELLEGMSLTRALREKRLDRPILKHIFIQIAETLEKAHRANIIHRDLKPDNVVLVHDDGDPHFVKLVDFGIAKMLQHKASNLTETGVILGTPYYMSPEQARGDPVDHRSDIYALGVMMYRAFTGRLPFVADTAMGVLTRHLTEKPELPSRIAEIDSALERLILRCLEKKPIDRFQSMADVAEALRAMPDEPSARRATDLTFDERSAPLKAASEPPAPISMPTPTRVATPHARRPSQVDIPSVIPPTRPEGSSVARPASIPPPLPSPAPPPVSVPPYAHPPGQAQPPAFGSDAYATPAGLTPAPEVPLSPITGPQQPLQQASGPYPVAGGASVETPRPLHLGSYDPLQGEAATNRGVVSSRLPSWHPPPQSERRVAVWVGAAVVTVVLIAAGAVALYPDGPAADADAPSSSAAPATAGEPTDAPDEPLDVDALPWASAKPVQHDEAMTSATASASTEAPPLAAPPPRPVPQARPRPESQPPPPEPEPDEPPPEIRSPFE